jgi:phosphotransferase system  glucose/maltose/N-acetylglucosamine-specific IIC component
MSIRGDLGVIGGALLGFEERRRCVLGLHWLQKPIDIVWPDLRAGDCRGEGLALSLA